MKLQHFQSPTARPVTLVLAIPLLTSLGCILRQTVAVRNCYTSRVCTLLHQRAFGHTVMPLACLAASRIRRTQIHVSELMLMNSIVLRRHRACCLPAGARSASARQSTVRVWRILSISASRTCMQTRPVSNSADTAREKHAKAMCKVFLVLPPQRSKERMTRRQRLR